jgi:diadenosine tetraphosphate (Ap4A) HIT family hydrolase
MAYKKYLWATSRGNWVKKEIKGCVFCEIAKDNPDVPKKVIYKGKEFMVIMNIFPYNVGHLQVIPVKHVEKLEELSDREITGLFLMVNKTIKMLTASLNPAGFNIGMNIGGDISGGSIMHLHVQIVPRYKRDSGFMEITADTKVMPESINQTYKKIMKNAGILKK